MSTDDTSILGQEVLECKEMGEEGMLTGQAKRGVKSTQQRGLSFARVGVWCTGEGADGRGDDTFI